MVFRFCVSRAFSALIEYSPNEPGALPQAFVNQAPLALNTYIKRDVPTRRQGSTLVRHSVGTQLLCLLEMFFGQVSHPQILKARREHPMVERIVRSELVRLVFEDTRLFGIA